MFVLSSEAKVGLFVLLGLVVLGYMSFRVGQQGVTLRKGYNVNVVFDNVAGLEKDASVQIAGVEMGRVEDIKLKEGKAQVTLRIEPGIRLEKDVTAAIKTHGVLGDKYVEISPGTKGEPFITPGGQIASTMQAADVDRLLQKVSSIADDIKTVTSALNRVMGGEAGASSLADILENTRQLTLSLNKMILHNEANFSAMLRNTRDLMGNLNTIVVENDGKVVEVINNLKSASKEMEKTFASLSDITETIRKGEGSMGQLVKDSSTVDKLNKALASFQEVSDKVNQGKGTIGKLINDEETVNNLNESLAGINRYVNKAEQFRTTLGYRGEYLIDNSNAKSYLDLRIQPNEDKFYILGIVNDPRGKRTIKDTTTDGVTTRQEEWDKSGFLFNLQIGKRFRDLVLRGGLMESTGGLGFDYMAFNDKLKLTFEAFDFAEDRRTHLKALAEYRLFKHFYLSGGWDDFISNKGNSSPFAGFAIRFEDEDLKYLLTTTPIPK